MYVTLTSFFVVMFILILFKIERKEKPKLTVYQFINNVGKNNDLLWNVYVGIMSGLVLSIIETNVIYDGIVSKSKKIISLNSVVNQTNNNFAHTIIFFLFGNLFFSIINSLNNTNNIPLWAHVIGIFLGFLIARNYIQVQHSNTLKMTA